MKSIVALAVAFSFSFTALAGNMKFTCKNSDGTVILTRERLVVLDKDTPSKQFELFIFKNTSDNLMPDKKETIEFETEDGNKARVGQLNIASLTNRRLIASEQGELCEGGRGPGFLTETYNIQGQLSIFDHKTRAIELSCVESSYWSGHCRPQIPN